MIHHPPAGLKDTIRDSSPLLMVELDRLTLGGREISKGESAS
jgi:hypothetical protein